MSFMEESEKLIPRKNPGPNWDQTQDLPIIS